MFQEKLYQFYYKKSRIQQLKGFCFTIKYGTIIKASEIMHLDPSTVVAQIKSLEADLHVKLFKKEGRNIIPTKKALKFYEEAIKLVELSDNIFSDFILENDMEYQNSLNICFADSLNFMMYEFMPYIAEFHKLHPKIKLAFDNEKYEKYTLLDKLKNKDIDIIFAGIFEDSDVLGKFDVTNLAPYDESWILSKKHFLAKKPENQLTIEDLVKSNFLFFPEEIHKSRSKRFYPFDDIIRKYNLKNKFVIKKGDMEILKIMVINNMCTTILPKLFIKEEDKKYVVCRKMPINLPRKRFCGYVIDNNAKPITREFAKFLKENFSIK